MARETILVPIEDVNNYGYNVRIVFSSINIQQLEEVDVFVSRIR